MLPTPQSITRLASLWSRTPRPRSCVSDRVPHTRAICASPTNRCLRTMRCHREDDQPGRLRDEQRERDRRTRAIGDGPEQPGQHEHERREQVAGHRHHAPAAGAPGVGLRRRERVQGCCGRTNQDRSRVDSHAVGAASHATNATVHASPAAITSRCSACLASRRSRPVRPSAPPATNAATVALCHAAPAPSSSRTWIDANTTRSSSSRLHSATPNNQPISTRSRSAVRTACHSGGSQFRSLAHGP